MKKNVNISETWSILLMIHLYVLLYILRLWSTTMRGTLLLLVWQSRRPGPSTVLHLPSCSNAAILKEKTLERCWWTFNTILRSGVEALVYLCTKTIITPKIKATDTVCTVMCHTNEGKCPFPSTICYYYYLLMPMTFKAISLQKWGTAVPFQKYCQQLQLETFITH